MQIFCLCLNAHKKFFRFCLCFEHLPAFKKCLDSTLRHMVWFLGWACAGSGHGLNDPCGSHTTTIQLLWFYDLFISLMFMQTFNRDVSNHWFQNEEYWLNKWIMQKGCQEGKMYLSCYFKWWSFPTQHF